MFCVGSILRIAQNSLLGHVLQYAMKSQNQHFDKPVSGRESRGCLVSHKHMYCNSSWQICQTKKGGEHWLLSFSKTDWIGWTWRPLERICHLTMLPRHSQQRILLFYPKPGTASPFAARHSIFYYFTLNLAPPRWAGWQGRGFLLPQKRYKSSSKWYPLAATWSRITSRRFKSA